MSNTKKKRNWRPFCSVYTGKMVAKYDFGRKKNLFFVYMTDDM